MKEINDLKTEKRGTVWTATLNRPGRLNALSKELVAGLQSFFREAKYDNTVRALVINGAGRAFCAGGDVKTMGSNDVSAIYQHLGALNELILQMSELEKPIVAAVHGYAAGAGMCLALACDQILAADDSQFALSFAKVGLISDGGGLFFLPRTIGLLRAKELLFTAEPIDAQKAQSWGLVNRVYPRERLKEKAVQYAEKLAAGPTLAYGFMKKIANQSLTAE